MKKTRVLLLLLLIAPISSYAQNKNADIVYASLYDYGERVSKNEDLFENLFRNWNTKFVENADDIQLVSYEFVQDITTKKDLGRYVDKIAKANYMYTNAAHSYSGKNLVEKEDGTVDWDPVANAKWFIYFPDEMIKELKQDDEKEKAKIRIKENKEYNKWYKKDIKRKLTRSMKFNTPKVYVIKYIMDGQEYDNYVICDSYPNVIADNIFNFKIPITVEKK